MAGEAEPPAHGVESRVRDRLFRVASQLTPLACIAVGPLPEPLAAAPRPQRARASDPLPSRARCRWAEYYGGRLIFYYDDEAGARAGQIRGAVNLKDAVLRVGYSEPGLRAFPAPPPGRMAKRRGERERACILSCHPGSGARRVGRGALGSGNSSVFPSCGGAAAARQAQLGHVSLPRTPSASVWL